MVPASASKVEGACKNAICQHSIPGESQQTSAPLADAVRLLSEFPSQMV